MVLGSGSPRRRPKMSNPDRIAALTQSLLDSFREGVVPAHLARTFLIPASAPSSRWTPTNQLLASIQGHAYDPRGFRQWQEVGRRVKKGARAGYILGPRLAHSNQRQALSRPP